jgi:hypothetical protein
MALSVLLFMGATEFSVFSLWSVLPKGCLRLSLNH